jgi:hypothetical protein
LFLGAAVALTIGVPIVAVAMPASAAGCTASVSNPAPAQNTTVTVSIVGPATSSATVVAHFRTTDASNTATTDTNGHGSAGFNLGVVTYGETVVVNVTFGTTASCSTTFTPTAPASSTTTTSTTAVLTGIASATSTTVAATRTTTTAAAAVTTGAVTAAAAAPSSLPFTGNATVFEATGGGLFLALGAFFLSSARRREELVRLLWPDER